MSEATKEEMIKAVETWKSIAKCYLNKSEWAESIRQAFPALFEMLQLIHDFDLGSEDGAPR
jgi:hypothetical protein